MKTDEHKGYKKKREDGDPIAAPAGNPRFIPIPDQFKRPNGDQNMDLNEVMDPEKVAKIIATGKMTFHSVGDTGPKHGDEAMKPISEEMEKEADESFFFYHLGDVVYFNGQSTQYDAQFYTYYDGYPGKIVAIPGNHDCSTVVQTGDDPDNEPSLTGFMKNFCADDQVYHDQSAHRKNMNQPWAYWTLNTPFATFIGLFSNYDGMLDKGNDITQYNWLVQQLKKAVTGKKLIITVHHPCFSLDTAEGGYPIILSDLDKAFIESNRYPDLVLSGHVHNYQRFTRTFTSLKGKKLIIPYIVCGAGGYANTPKAMHKLQKIKGKQIPANKSYKISSALLENRAPIKKFELSLDSYNEVDPGFLRITIDKNNKGQAVYVTCPFTGEAGSVEQYDNFSF